MKEYKDTFPGLEQFPEEYKNNVSTTVDLIIHVPWKIPVALKDPMVKVILRVENLRTVITKVYIPTERINSMMGVVKPRELSLWLDL